MQAVRQQNLATVASHTKQVTRLIQEEGSREASCPYAMQGSAAGSTQHRRMRLSQGEAREIVTGEYDTCSKQGGTEEM
jgi:hypothetical protein